MSSSRLRGPRLRPDVSKDHHSSSHSPSPGNLASSPVLTPTAPLSIANKTKPKLKLSPINTAEVSGDEHSYYNLPQSTQGYAQPIAIPVPTSQADDNSRTLRPPMSDEPGSFHVSQIRDVLTEIEHRSESRMSKRSSGPTDQTNSSNSPVSLRQQPSTDTSNSTSATTASSGDNSKGWDNEKWSDEVLEVVSRLGEGAGGAVYKVKDTRNGDLLARKTIPTRTTPARQLLAELKHLSNTRHSNICEFYGAYMSSSSSEVNVVMELCEGGSLEAIMEKLQERQGRVGEQLIGKLAEGVRIPSDPDPFVVVLIWSVRSSAAWSTFTPSKSFIAILNPLISCFPSTAS
jgi:hypothetical protein